MAGNDFCGAAGMKQTLKSSPPRLPMTAGLISGPPVTAADPLHCHQPADRLSLSYTHTLL